MLRIQSQCFVYSLSAVAVSLGAVGAVLYIHLSRCKLLCRDLRIPRVAALACADVCAGAVL